MFQTIQAREDQSAEDFLASQMYLGDLPKPASKLTLQEAEDLVNASRLADYMTDGRENFFALRGNKAAQMQWVDELHAVQRRELADMLHRPLSMSYGEMTSSAMNWSANALQAIADAGGISMQVVTRAPFRRAKKTLS